MNSFQANNSDVLVNSQLIILLNVKCDWLKAKGCVAVVFNVIDGRYAIKKMIMISQGVDSSYERGGDACRLA